jgi:FkbM family methyltransferase
MIGHGEHLGEILARWEIDCVVDAGAHLGQFGELVRGVGYARSIVSFEPVLPVFAALAKRVGADPGWSAHRLALGASDGTAELNVPRATDFSSFLQPNAYSLETFDGATAVERVEQVPVRRLDSVADEYLPASGSRLFLKLDTQGWELEVLKGAEDTLAHVVALQVELSLKPVYDGAPPYFEVAAYLDRHGFEVTGFFPVAHDDDLGLIETDCVMVRRG